MEIEGEDGTKVSLKPGVKAMFGRGSGLNTDDLTVSRRHVSLELKPAAAGTEWSDRVSFEVLGRNPVWVRSGKSDEKIRAFRKSEKGEIAAGDRFCVSGQVPVWFNLKRRDGVTEESFSDCESGLDNIDISDIDPVKEFGFLVIGKEFDQYAKSRIRDIKQWEWFLEDSTKANSDEDDDEEKKGRKGLSKKRRRRKGNEDDDDWSVDSEEDKELMVNSKRVMTPSYSTRSKKTKKDINATSSSSHAQTKQRASVDVEEDDDDETLGGFIVSDEEAKLEEEEESNKDDEEEDEDEDEDED